MESGIATRTFGRFGALTLLLVALLVAGSVSLAYGAPRNVTFAVASKKPKPKPSNKKAKLATLATATAWLTLGPDAKLIAQGTPQQFTDPSTPQVQQLNTLINGLGFKGLVQAGYARTPDPSVTGVPVGNYILKLVVFGSAADAQKFRDADAAQVTGGGRLKQVGTVPNGVVLDDGQGHINAMLTINNAVADLRIGVSETAPGDGVKEIQQLANLIVANSKKS